MAQTGKTFRIFVSSTFSDMAAERNALQEHVFPRLRELAMRHGCRFQAIDLRWGVSEEAGLDQQTMRICLEELRRCQQVTPRPNFIVLLGDRYGWQPLPEEIPADEYTAIEGRISPRGRELLRAWYRRDDNALCERDGQWQPGVWILQPRTGRFSEYGIWAREVERPLHETLREVVGGLSLPAESRLKYEASATHQEIEYGALQAGCDAEHVFALFRHIANLEELQTDLPLGPAGRFVDTDSDGRIDRHAHQAVLDLEQRLRASIGANAFACDAHWTGDGISREHIGELPAQLDACERMLAPGYAPRNLCEAAWHALGRMILAECTATESVDALEMEAEAHRTFGRERARAFVGREDNLDRISSYLAGNGSGPYALWGASGSGKSALMARAYEQARAAHGTAVLVSRFIGATPGSTDGRSLLEGLCREIARAYGQDDPYTPTEYRELVQELPKRIALASAEKPLIVFIDALDQLSVADHARLLPWLPQELPEHARIVVSTIPGDCLDALTKKVPVECRRELGPLDAGQGRELLERWLCDAHRTLTQEQREHVEARFAASGLPLYLKLAFEEVRRWHSYDGLPCGGDEVPGLSTDTPSVIRDLFSRLAEEANHGRVLLSRSLGYLSAARHGLSEDELLEVLWQDEEVREDFARRFPQSPSDVRALPVVVWSRLYAELKPYLVERDADGANVMGFFHRQLDEAVEREFLAGTDGPARHQGLARFFAQQPLWLEGDRALANRRRLAEQPYQETLGGLGADLVRTLTDLEFIEAKCDEGLTHDLLADYNNVQEAVGITEAERAAIEPFARFARTRSHAFVSMRGLVLQEAYNAAPSDAIREQARALLDKRGRAWVRSISVAAKRSVPCLQTLTGHTAGIDTVALNPDGSRLVTGGRDRTVRVWDLATGACLHTLQGYPEAVNALVLTPDGERVVTASGVYGHPGEAWVSNLATGACLQTLPGHGRGILAMALSPDGRWLVTGSADCTARVWDLSTSACVRVLEGHTGDVGAVAFSPDGRQIVTSDHSLRLWDLASGACLRTLAQHQSKVNTLAITPDGRLVVTGSWDQAVYVWDLQTGDQRQQFLGHQGLVFAVAVTADARQVVTGGWDRTVRVWDLATGACEGVLTGHASTVSSVVLIGEHRAASGGLDDVVKVWDLTALADQDRPAGHRSEVYAVAVTPDGRRAVTGSMDSTVGIWDLETGTCQRMLEGHAHSISSVAITPDSRRAVVGAGVHHTTDPGELKVWDLESGACLRDLPGHPARVRQVLLAPDGRRAVTLATVAAGDMRSSGEIKAWDLRSGACVWTQRCRGDTTEALLTPNGRYLAVGARYLDEVLVWNLATGAHRHTLKGPVQCLAPTPDGRQLLVGAEALGLWDLATGERMWSVACSEECSNLRVTPDGQLVLIGGFGVVEVRDLGSGALRKVLHGHTTWVSLLALTPDGHYLVTGGQDDDTLQVWDLALGARVACFFAEGGRAGLATSPNGRRLVLGAKSGSVLFLTYENVELDAPVVTALRSASGVPWLFWRRRGRETPGMNCPACRAWSELPAVALGTQTVCPHCGTAIRLNPFTIDADWRAVAAAWARDGAKNAK